MIGSYLQNRYRIIAELGQGGMGTVYRADDTLLDRPVALKVLSSAGLGTEGRVRLSREARAAARLNHTNIMSIYDAGEAAIIPLNYQRFIFMLKPWVKRFPVSPLKTTYWKDVIIEPH